MQTMKILYFTFFFHLFYFLFQPVLLHASSLNEESFLKRLSQEEDTSKKVEQMQAFLKEIKSEIYKITFHPTNKQKKSKPKIDSKIKQLTHLVFLKNKLQALINNTTCNSREWGLKNELLDPYTNSFFNKRSSTLSLKVLKELCPQLPLEWVPPKVRSEVLR